MTTNMTPWSLGMCPNKSLNLVEPPVPPLASDLNDQNWVATPDAQFPRPGSSGILAAPKPALRTLSNIIQFPKIFLTSLPSVTNYRKSPSELCEKSQINVRNVEKVFQLATQQYLTPDPFSDHCRKSPNFVANPFTATPLMFARTNFLFNRLATSLLHACRTLFP